MSHDYPQGDPFPELLQRFQRWMTPDMEPPILSNYSDAPVYDIITLAGLVKVKPITLWAWEQQLGISSGEPNHEADNRRRRTERDLVALLWVKEMVMAGASSQDAAARLIAAQRARNGTGYLNSGALNSGALSTGALNPQAFNPPPPRAPAPPPTGALGSATYPGGNLAYPDLNASGVRPTPDAGMMRGSSGAQWGSSPRQPAPVMRPGGMSGPLNANTYSGQSNYGAAPQAGGQSGRLGGVFSGSLEAQSYPPRGMTPSRSMTTARELRPAITQLLQSFARFDTARANAVMMEALNFYGVDNVCVGLVQPTVQRIGELWSKSELTNPEERFSLNYLRTFLHSVYHSTPEPLGAPLAVVGCAPNEPDEFSALLLAVLWRRTGVRVAYLGRGIDGDQLTDQTWPLPPTIIALNASTTHRIRALQRICKRLSDSPQPQPIFAYWGAAFVRSPDQRRKIAGVYLGDDLASATRTVRQLLNMDAFGE